LKEDKLRQLKKVIITPNESVCDFNTRFLELYDQLDFNDNLLYLLLIMKMLYDQEVEYMKWLLWLMLIILRMPVD